MDALSRKALIHNWSLVLAGKESEVSSVLGTKEDALDLAINESIENKNEEELKLRKYRLKGLNMIIFGLRFIWDLFWYQSLDSKTIFLPKKVMKELLNQAQNDLIEIKDQINQVNQFNQFDQN